MTLRDRYQHKDMALEALLATHQSVYVHVDTRLPGVVVPEKLLGKPQVAFKLGYETMTDFDIDTVGWSARLLVGGNSFEYRIPWSAVYFIVGDSGAGQVWEVDVPAEAQVQRVVKDSPENMKVLRAAKKIKGVLLHRIVERAFEKKARAAKTLPPGWRIIEGGRK